MKNKYLAAALENLSETLVIDQPDAPATLTPAPGELDAERELLADQGAADQLTDAAISLEEILESLNYAADEEGGLSPQATRFAQLATQAAVTPLGMTVEQPALESAMSDRLVARLTMESVGETLQKVMHQIIEFCRRLWQKVAAFFEHMFDRLNHIGASAKKLAAVAKEKQSWTLDVKEIDIGRNGAFFDGVKDPGPWLEQVGKLIAITAHGARETLGESTKTIVSTYENLKDDWDAFPSVVLASPVPKDIFKAPVAVKKDGAWPREEYEATMRGGYMLVLDRPADATEVTKMTFLEALQRMKACGTERWSLEQIKATQAIPPAKVITNHQLEDMLTTLSFVCNKALETKAAITREVQEAQAQIRQFETLATKLAVTPSSHARLAASHAFQRLQRAQTAGTLVFTKYLALVGQGYMQYAKAHIEALKAPASAAA